MTGGDLSLDHSITTPPLAHLNYICPGMESIIGPRRPWTTLAHNIPEVDILLAYKSDVQEENL